MNNRHNHMAKNRQFFFGAVGASLSHEINNVFAIIGELNGLLEDLSISREDSHEISPDRLKNITERIAAQMERGKVYIKQLNSFSHSVEVSDQDLDATEVLNNVVDLCARIARLCRVGIDIETSEESFVVNGDQFDLQHILYCCIELALRTSDEGTSIDIMLTKEGEDICFKFANKQPGNTSEDICDKISAIESITEHLGGLVNIDIGGGSPMKMDLCLPRKLRKLND